MSAALRKKQLAAERMKRLRERQRAGLTMLCHLAVDEVALTEALLASGRLPKCAGEDREAIAVAAAALIADWAAHVTRHSRDPLAPVVFSRESN